MSKSVQDPAAGKTLESGENSGLLVPEGDFLHTVELSCGLVVTLAVVLLNVHYVRHAGGLWRDEVSSVSYGSLPSLPDVWKNNRDSFPNLWPTCLHGWISWGPGKTDDSLRLFGLLASLGLVGMCWWSTRKVGVRVPWVLLLFIGLNPTVIVYGSQVRGYGLGMITELGMLASFLLFAQQPSPRRALWAAVAALLCAQALYANCMMVAAAGTAVGLVLLWQRQWRAIAMLFGVCGIAAASMLPYWRTYESIKEWRDILQGTYGVNYLWGTIITTASSSGFDMTNLLPATLLGAVLIALMQLVFSGLSARFQGKSLLAWFVVATVLYLAIPFAYLTFGQVDADFLLRFPLLQGGSLVVLWLVMFPSPNGRAARARTAIWCVAGMALSLTLHFAYLRFLSVGGSYWYNFPVLVFVAFGLELLLDGLIGANRLGRAVRLAGALFLAWNMVQADWQQVDVRMTSVDLAAAAVQKQAEPGDLIVVWPAHLNCVFHRYYTGSVPWIGIPDIEEKQWMDPSDVLRKMRQENPIQTELKRIEATLRLGHRVWFVGGVRFYGIWKVAPPVLPSDPANGDPRAWRYSVYMDNWSEQVGFLLQSHCPSIKGVDYLPPEMRFQPAGPTPAEVAPILVAKGWQ